MSKRQPINQAVVRQIALFRSLDDAQALQVSALLQEQHYRKGEIICFQGDAGSCMYIISSGRVRIYLTSPGGREITLRIYTRGAAFGELAMLDGGLRSASAVALSDVTVLVLYRDDLMGLLRRNFALVEHLIAMLTERVRYTTAYSKQLVFQRVPERVAALLIQLSGEGETASPDLMRIDVTQHELAAFVGTTGEWINRVLHSFADAGLVRIERGTLVVLDRAGLQRLVK